MKKAFLTIVFAMLLVPLVCMPFTTTERTSSNENNILLNENILSNLGTCFESNFAFRNELITAHNFLTTNIFGESGTEQVILGKDGYLFYEGTLDDYEGTNELSDVELENIAHNLFLTQMYIQSTGQKFIFTIAPNKNTLYGDLMPEQYEETRNAHNMERLAPYLQKYGVNYVNLLELFQEQDEIFYAKQDSHWTAKGALLAANALLSNAGKAQLNFTNWSPKIPFSGDIFNMLYPALYGDEEQELAVGVNDGGKLKGGSWQFTNGATEVDNEVSATSSNSEEASGSLYMFRDSFANQLIPYLSTSYATATYTKMIPYDVIAAVNSHANTVFVERAERHLSYLTKTAPIMYAPELTAFNEADSTLLNPTNINISSEGSVISVSAEIPPTETFARNIIKVTDNNTFRTGYFEAFNVFNDNVTGIQLYLDSTTWSSSLNIEVYQLKA